MRLAMLFLPLMLTACPGDPLDADEDEDGYTARFDCDDGDPEVHPAALEQCNGIDDNCDGVIDRDATDRMSFFRDQDGDGYGSADTEVVACEAPEGFVDNNSDCNDLFDTALPGGTEVCDGLDNDCNGRLDDDPADPSTFYEDADGDGYGVEDGDTVEACQPPDGYAFNVGDCADDDEARNPGADELCDGIDQDCDGERDEDAIDQVLHWPDADGDGHGDPMSEAVLACPSPEGWAPDDVDCDDTEPAIHGEAEEICDGLDNDCDETTLEEGLVTLNGVNRRSLQSALDAVIGDGEIGVCAGDWEAAGVVSTGRNLTLIGYGGRDSVVLRPSAVGRSIVRVEANATLTVSGVTFTEGNAVRGGAIDAEYADGLSVSNCIFTENSATEGGAIIGPLYGPLTTIADSEFTRNYSSSAGGAFFAGATEGATTTFAYNSSGDSAGAIFVKGDSTFDEHTVFHDNEAPRGGALLIQGARFSGAEFYGNSAAKGGAVSILNGGVLASSHLHDNAAEEEGGGIHIALDGTVETVLLESNVATWGGGAFVDGDDGSFSSCELADNSATYGGGLASVDADVLVDGGRVEQNTATRGGGAYVDGGSLESIAADWGSDATDNDPDDVEVVDGTTYERFGAGESFTCVAADGTCE